MKDLFSTSIPLLEIVLRTVVIYLVVLVGLRLSGKREVGQMTIFDLVVLLLIANAVQNAMNGGDNSLLGGLAAAATLLVINAVLAQLRLRSPMLRKLIEGSPTLLVLHGEPIEAHMRREGIDEDTLEAALREHGVESIEQAEMVVLEIDGSMSVVPSSSTFHRIKKPIRYPKH